MVHTTVSPTSLKKGSPRWRTVVLLLGAVTFVLNISVATHELGHLIVDRIYGLDASVVLEPFRGSYTVLAQPYPADVSIWPVVAGPLANVAVGALLFGALWRVRRPMLVPFLIWGPIAFIQESTTALVQMATREAGTDWVLINQAGLASGIIVGLAILGLVAGLGGLLLVLPVAGLSPATRLTERLAMLAIGMGGFMVLALGLSMALGYPAGDVSRNLRVTVFVLLIAGLLAAVYPVVARFRPGEVMEVPIGAAWTAVGIGVVVLALFLVI